MLIIDLIPKMANLLNEFILEYSQKINIKPLKANEVFKLHTEMTNLYSIKAIKLAMQYVDNEEVEVNFNNWLKKHGGK